MKLNRRAILIILVITIGSAAYYFNSRRIDETASQQASREPLAEIKLPVKFSETAIEGKAVFNANCATCHGANAVGQNGVAPPLIHPIYEPGHHGDEAFQRAAAMGSPAHHWPFGDMPPVDGVTRDDIAKVVAYIREIQRANGIN